MASLAFAQTPSNLSIVPCGTLACSAGHGPPVRARCPECWWGGGASAFPCSLCTAQAHLRADPTARGCWGVPGVCRAPHRGAEVLSSTCRGSADCWLLGKEKISKSLSKTVEALCRQEQQADGAGHSYNNLFCCWQERWSRALSPAALPSWRGNTSNRGAAASCPLRSLSHRALSLR